MDVTDRKNMELALRESEERFRLTFSRSPVGAAIVAPDYTFQQANESFCTLIGYTENELRQLTFADVTHPESRLSDIEQVSRLLSGEISRYETDKRYIHKDGHVVWGRVVVSLVRNSEKTPLYFLPIVQDITERKRAEEALLESEERLKSIFLAAPVGIGLTCNRIITDANDTLCRMTGYERQDLVGKSARMLYPDDSEFEFVGREKYRQIMERGTGTVETRWVRKDGTCITIILSSTPLHPGEFSRGVTFTALDISELRNSIHEKEVLLREVHHRVKNNLAAIIALLELQQKGIGDTKAVASLQDLAGRIKSMALVHERLYRSDNLARIDFEGYLIPLISHLRTTFGVPAPVRCDIDVAGIELGLDLAIPCALIVNELVTNAIKHAFPHGNPGPGAETCDIRIAVKMEGDECTLSVADNGVGLPPDLDWRSCSSLGLRLVRMLGEHQLGGKILLDRTEGTRFILRFAGRGARLNHGR
jgi:PAS domain S-box-containing protein